MGTSEPILVTDEGKYYHISIPLLVFIVHHYYPHPALRATFPQGKALYGSARCFRGCVILAVEMLGVIGRLLTQLGAEFCVAYFLHQRGSLGEQIGAKAKALAAAGTLAVVPVPSVDV